MGFEKINDPIRLKETTMIMEITKRLTMALRPFGLAQKFLDLILAGEKFFYLDLINDPFSNGIKKRLVVEIPGRGCSWFKSSGGCTMCGFNRKLEAVHKEWNFSDDDLANFYFLANSLTVGERPEVLYIYNGGSFLNEAEIPLKTQLLIAKGVGDHPSLNRFFVESRPEFLTREALTRIRNVLGGKKLQIGLGLETVTDEIRQKYIRKGFSLADYQQAVSILKDLNVDILTYVFLKPLGLSEKGAIEEAVKTIKHVFKTAGGEVSLSCAFVQENTPMEQAYKSNKFWPPWLWSIIEVVRQTSNLGPVRIGSFKDTPKPIVFPHNCPNCSDKFIKAINEYNLNRDVKIFDNLSCNCHGIWQAQLK